MQKRIEMFYSTNQSYHWKLNQLEVAISGRLANQIVKNGPIRRGMTSFSKSFHYFLLYFPNLFTIQLTFFLYFPKLFTIFFHIFNIISLFSSVFSIFFTIFFHIFPISSQFSSVFSKSFHYSTHF